MATSELKSKFGSATQIACTLNSLASSTANVGRQGDLVDNTTNRFGLIHLWVTLKTGTTSFAAGFAYVWLIRSDGTRETDGAGASNAGFTAVNAKMLGALALNASATTYVKDFWIADPGPKWTVAVSQSTVAALDASAGGSIYYTGDNEEAQ
jgi:hypothetical protein